MAAQEGFDELVRRATDEPLLGPRQGALIGAATHRLATGSPMNEWDYRCFVMLAGNLGLEIPEARPQRRTRVVNE